VSAHGDLLRAQETLLRALNITRAMGDRHREAYYLLELGNHHYKLGDYQAARESLEQTKAIFLQIDEARGHGYALADLGLVYHALGDDDMAVDCCTRGRDLLHTVGDRWGEAGCHQHLGLVMESLGDLDSATDLYTRASVMNQEIQQPARALENRLGLARIALTRGRVAEALEPVKGMVAWMSAEGIQSLDFPFVAYMTIFQVLIAAGDTERARRYLTEAHNALMERAEKLEDPSSRDLFLKSVAVHREIVATYRDLQTFQQAHQITVSLPRADAPLGRPLREDELVTVGWTVAAPEDGTIGGKVARRRHRILRLLQEAQDQGAAPTHSHLAEALGVSRRTIERDMAALRSEHPGMPPTRGRMSE
jgi:tetratricopeptide (TPR) repeat protein